MEAVWPRRQARFTTAQSERGALSVQVEAEHTAMVVANRALRPLTGLDETPQLWFVLRLEEKWGFVFENLLGSHLASG